MQQRNKRFYYERRLSDRGGWSTQLDVFYSRLVFVVDWQTIYYQITFFLCISNSILVEYDPNFETRNQENIHNVNKTAAKIALELFDHDHSEDAPTAYCDRCWHKMERIVNCPIQAITYGHPVCKVCLGSAVKLEQGWLDAGGERNLRTFVYGLSSLPSTPCLAYQAPAYQYPGLCQLSIDLQMKILLEKQGSWGMVEAIGRTGRTTGRLDAST